LVKGGPGPIQRGENHKKCKMGWEHLKIFSRTTEPVLTRLGKNHPWVEEIQVCSEKRIAPLKGEIIAKE
jgi:hypothetical protein